MENDVDGKEKKGKSNDFLVNEMFFNVMDKTDERGRKEHLNCPLFSSPSTLFVVKNEHILAR